MRLNFNGHLIVVLPVTSLSTLRTWSVCRGYDTNGAGIDSFVCRDGQGEPKKYKNTYAAIKAAKKFITSMS